MTLNIFKNEKNLKQYKTGDVIFEQGDAGSTMYAVREGIVEIIFEGEVMNTIYEGEVFGEMALVDREPRSARAIAKTDCELVEIDEERFKSLVHTAPFFALQVLRVTVDRLRKTMEMTKK